MDIAALSIRNKVVTLVATAGLLLGGLNAFNNMSRLEDPEFTIKDALVMTQYPGASAIEVEEEVTDALETAIQQLGQLDEIKSQSDRGLSTITVTIKDNFDKSTLPQVWDELRRKVNDAQGDLPPGAGPSVVVDDYGDVYGVFLAITSDGYTYAELKNYVDLLRRELLLVDDVGKIETYGERSESVYVEFDRDRMSQLGIPVSAILDELEQKNAVTNSGRVRVGSEFITLEPTGLIDSVEAIESLLIRGGDEGRQLFLRDVATVKRGYVEPPQTLIRFDGKMAIGLGISTVSGGNVITMGQALRARLIEMEEQRPIGIDFGLVSVQSDAVTTAIAGFTSSLLQAVAIVIVVLMVFMGLRSALIIGFVLVITIAGSFIFLDPMEVALERISLGALIIALGMLVDNAIVVVDGMLIRMQSGSRAEDAASDVVKQSAWPLLGATLVAIMAFAAIGTSDDSTGEFCRSLFQVVMVSLLLSWVTAVTITPLLGTMLLNAPEGEGKDPYDTPFYQRYRDFLRLCIRKRYLSSALVAGIFAISVWGFGSVDQVFFPSSTRPQFMVDVWLPQGTHIDETTALVADVEKYVSEQEGVTHVTSLIGQGGLRFLLTYAPEKLNSAYAQLLVDVDDYRSIDMLKRQLDDELRERFPEALMYTSKFQLGPGSTGKIQARFSGPNANELRKLADQALDVLRADPDSKAVRTDWRERVKIVRPVLAEQQANVNGITRANVSATLLEGFQGVNAGIYREGDLLLPIVVRAAAEQRSNISSADSLQIWSPAAEAMIPLRQVVSEFRTDFEDEIIFRKNRKRTLTVYGDPDRGLASAMFARVRPQIEAIELPLGYTLEWGGEYEDSGNAQAALAGKIPIFVMLMILITIVLFNSLRQPLVIWLCVPLAIIGVTAGLLATGQPFGFMALLGFLSLSGMLIKNAIVLIDQINLESSEGKALLPAIVDSGVSRLRPVAMAALTTALGMIPLLFDAFFVSMAITIIGGLLFASVLTMIIVPVFYAILFRAPAE